ncbi:MAG: hypothetical protein Q7R35_17605 [Elusimicrobiota bacterium]|nr:hypothetical protein [Elusimicrobiota bacterium]
MKTTKLILLLAVLPAFWGCASFNSGDIRVERDTAQAMLEDKGIIPFSDIQVSWQNFPYRAPTDSIGEGSTRPKKIKPRPVDPVDAANLNRKAREIFSDAGLYDKARGRGTLRLELTSFGRWTYNDLFRSYLVDTVLIFILPSSLRVNYYLTADFAVSTGTVRVETEAVHKTTFHLLMAPLYPFLSPGTRENGLLRQMLWRSATDVYSRLKAAGYAPYELPQKAAQPETETQPLSGPPMPPDRTWLPGEAVEGAPAPDKPEITPEKPDQTWAVPSARPQVPAEQPVKAAPAPPAPAAPADQPAPAKETPAPEETPDD